MTSGPHIDYDALERQALRGVVKACLAQVARAGLVGDHHFYIAFNTQAPGVGMSKRLKEKYPVEMTIVLQHRFWDLLVDDERFEVKLTFDGIPERLVVPFATVKVFYDPSVPYVLQFEDFDPATGVSTPRRSPRRLGGPNSTASPRGPEDMAETADAPPEKVDRRKGPRKARSEPAIEAMPHLDNSNVATPADERAPDVFQPVATPPAKAPPIDSKPAIVAVSKPDATDAEDGSEPEGDGGDVTAPTETGGAQIFDISKFRGKK